MKTYVITIRQDDADADIEHYRRRVEIDDLNFLIRRLDESLNYKVRKTRSDKGKVRAETTT